MDPDRVKIKPLCDADDYALWKIRIEVACEAKNLGDVLRRQRNPYSDEEKKKRFIEDQKKASGIIVAALSNETLRIVQSDVGKPYDMIVKLDSRFDSSTTASRIGTMCDLVLMKYNNIHDHLGPHIDRMRSMMSKLEATNMALSEQLRIGLQVASIEAPALSAVCAAIKTLCNDQTTWETVTTRLLDEHRTLRLRHHERANKAHLNAGKCCALCHRPGHVIEKCWLNPTNPENRLGIKLKGRKERKQKKDVTGCEDRKPKHNKNKGKTENEVRAAVAHATVGRTPEQEEFMLDSGTTTHMTPNVNSLEQKRPCNVNIALGDDSIVKDTVKGTRSVQWNHDGQRTTVQLSRTLGAPDLSMNLLSVPALTSHALSVLFMPDAAYIIDLQKDYQIIGSAPKRSDGLYYIRPQSRTSPSTAFSARHAAMMSVVRNLPRLSPEGCSKAEPIDLQNC